MTTGRIFDIQQFCTHDGPGIRTVVFLKGCPLHCVWCHNPEGIAPKPILSYLEARCTGCLRCAEACEHEVHQWNDRGKHVVNRDRCIGCGRCVTACPNGALERVGRDMTVDEVLARLMIDLPFFSASGGGLTLSGGEPLSQPDFTVSLLRATQTAGIHSLIETSGFATWSTFEKVLPDVDGFLYDIKETDSSRHKELTGQGNERILQNLRQLHDCGADVTVRMPIVPGLNDHQAHLDAVDAMMAEMPRLKGPDIMPYHPLGRSKCARFGFDDRDLATLNLSRLKGRSGSER